MISYLSEIFITALVLFLMMAWPAVIVYACIESRRDE